MDGSSSTVQVSISTRYDRDLIVVVASQRLVLDRQSERPRIERCPTTRIIAVAHVDSEFGRLIGGGTRPRSHSVVAAR